MFIPSRTDAVCHYWPFATVGLIAARLALTSAYYLGGVDIEASPFGASAIAPLVSLDLYSLIFECLMLWVLGIVVEGKLGWAKYLATLAVLILVTILVNFVVGSPQAMLATSAHGYTAPVAGLIAIAAVWAPVNHIEVDWYYYMGRSVEFQVPIAMGAVVVFGLNTLVVLLIGSSAFGLFAHLATTGVGAVLAVVMLKAELVDCEGWDIFHVWANDPGGVQEQAALREQKATEREDRRKQQAEQLKEDASVQVRKYLESGNADAAKTLVDKLGASGADIHLGEADLTKLVNALHKKKQWAESAPLMAWLIRVAPDRADRVRLLLAQICVAELERPGRAIDLLAETDVPGLPPKQQQLAAKIIARAEAMQASGLVELDDDQW